MQLQTTEEQEAVITSDADKLRVIAFAGCGKTTVLDQRARAWPNERMLYLAFNASTKEEARNRFPRNVRSSTFHGLAFPQFGSKYAEAGKLVQKLRVNEVAAALDLDAYPDDFRLYAADLAMKALQRYLSSDARALGLEHCDGLSTPGSGLQADDVFELTQTLWDKMCDLADRSIGMLHDGYLKLYQISNPVLGFDTILFDEYQDTNPVAATIFEAQRTRKIVVGDPHQQMYSFRGAINALRKFEADKTLYLTRSFRFGQGIADVANLVLSTFKRENRPLRGTDAPAHIGRLATAAHCTVIARANGTLFDEAAQAIRRGSKVHFLGGIDGYRVGDTLDCYNLWAGNVDQVRNPYLRSFRQFDRMEEYAGLVEDRELKSMISLVKRHGSKLPQLVQQIRGGTTTEQSQAAVVFTTAHKSKGLEWPNVRLTDDFFELLDDKGMPRPVAFADQEEVNIVYVASTRARKALCPFPELMQLVQQEKARLRADKLPEWAQPARAQGLPPRSAPVATRAPSRR